MENILNVKKSDNFSNLEIYNRNPGQLGWFKVVNTVTKTHLTGSYIWDPSNDQSGHILNTFYGLSISMSGHPVCRNEKPVNIFQIIYIKTIIKILPIITQSSLSWPIDLE